MTAIGADLSESFSVVKAQNVIVEGISDYYYLTALRKLFANAEDNFSVFPGEGASTVPTFASLMIGWRANFCALLDRDSNGNAAAKKLVHDMDVGQERVLQIEGGVAIEDLFTVVDFAKIVALMPGKYKIDLSSSPSKNISKLGLNKVLISRTFAAAVEARGLQVVDFSEETSARVSTLFDRIGSALRTNELDRPPDRLEREISEPV